METRRGKKEGKEKEKKRKRDQQMRGRQAASCCRPHGAGVSASRPAVVWLRATQVAVRDMSWRPWLGS
jgi:hypothetical protein